MDLLKKSFPYVRYAKLSQMAYFVKKHGLVLTRLIFWLLFFVVIATILVISTRSIWVDEATLLINVYNISWLQVLKPLPYYDQASPILPLIIIKMIANIAGTNFPFFRVLLFSVNIAFTIPLIRWLIKEKSLLSACWYVMAVAATIYSTGYYFTEIKHYGFEVAALFLFLHWFLIYLENRNQALSNKLIWLPILSISMGFSTLLLAPAFLSFVVINSLLEHQFKLKSLQQALQQHAKIIVLLLVTCTIFYMQMKQLTVFQIGNTWSQKIYGNKGFNADVASLYTAFEHAFSPKMIILAVLSSFITLFLAPKSTVFKLNLFFINFVLIVFALKILGIYPVLSGRHVVWMLPISMLITALLIPQMLQSKYKVQQGFAWAIIGILLLTFANNLLILRKGINAEVTSNNALYAALEKQPASDVLVFIAAQASLEIFQMKNKMNLAFTKHRFYGFSLTERVSSMKVAADEQKLSDWQFSQLPQTQSFLVLISHDKNINTEPASKRILALRSTLAKNNCDYQSIYVGKNAQLLKVRCH